MNSHLPCLLKIEITRTLATFFAGKKKAKTPLLTIIALFGVLFVGMSALYTWLIAMPYIKEGLDPSPALAIFAGLASLLCFVSCFNQARGLYIGEDHDFLAAMPLKTREIIAAKLLSLYATELLFSVVVLIPHGVTLWVMTHQVGLFLYALLFAFTVPLVPISIAALMSLVVTMATAKFKSANLVFTIFYVLLLVVFVGGISVINNLKSDQAIGAFSGISGVLRWVNPSFVLAEMGLQGQPWLVVLFVLIGIASAGITVMILGLSYERLHEIVSSIAMRKTAVTKELKAKTPSRTLLSLEFKRVANSKMYLANSIMGTLMSVVATVLTLLSLQRAKGSTSDPTALAMMMTLTGPICVVVVATVIGISNPTTAAINIEGKNFWLIKSLPTDYRLYMRSKLLFAWILTMPGVIIAGIIGIVFHHTSVWEPILMIVVPLLYCVLNSLIGLIVNVRHPKVKWNSEAEAVKNAASVLIAMLIHFGITIVMGTLVIVSAIFLPSQLYLGYVVFGGLSLVGIVIAYIYLRKNFAKRMDVIEEL